MASQAKIDANRKNAKKSTGPKTGKGKEASSQNAFKHELFVKKAVLRGEIQQEYDLPDRVSQGPRGPLLNSGSRYKSLTVQSAADRIPPDMYMICKHL